MLNMGTNTDFLQAAKTSTESGERWSVTYVLHGPKGELELADSS
jgi:hypothetical protein